MRYIWQKFPRCQNSTRGTSLSRLISGCICSCAVRTTFWNSEPSGTVWTDRSERGRTSQGRYVSRWTLRYALAGDRCALKDTRWQGWQNGPLKTPEGDGHCKTWCWPLHFGGGGWDPHWPEPSGVRSFFQPPPRNTNGPQICFTLWRLRLSTLPKSPFFGGEAR